MDFGSYLFYNKKLEQDPVPFIGDLYDPSSEKFHQFNDKKLYVKSLDASSTRFFGEIVVASIQLKNAPSEYDNIITGVEILIPVKRSQPIKGLWILADTSHSEKYKSYDLRIKTSPGEIVICKYFYLSVETMMHSVECIKNVHFENSFFNDVRAIQKQIDDVRRMASGIISYADASSLEEISKSSKQYCRALNSHLLTWVRNISGENWIIVTYSAIKQLDKVSEFVKIKSEATADFSQKYQKKLSLINSFNKDLVEYVCSVNQWQSILAKNSEVIALFFDEGLSFKSSKEFWCFNYHRNTMANSKVKFCAVDLCAVSHLEIGLNENTVAVKKYFHGLCACENLYSEQKYGFARNLENVSIDLKKASLTPHINKHFNEFLNPTLKHSSIFGDLKKASSAPPNKKQLNKFSNPALNASDIFNDFKKSSSNKFKHSNKTSNPTLNPSNTSKELKKASLAPNKAKPLMEISNPTPNTSGFFSGSEKSSLTPNKMKYSNKPSNPSNTSKDLNKTSLAPNKAKPLMEISNPTPNPSSFLSGFERSSLTPNKTKHSKKTSNPSNTTKELKKSSLTPNKMKPSHKILNATFDSSKSCQQRGQSQQSQTSKM